MNIRIAPTPTIPCLPVITYPQNVPLQPYCFKFFRVTYTQKLRYLVIIIKTIWPPCRSLSSISFVIAIAPILFWIILENWSRIYARLFARLAGHCGLTMVSVMILGEFTDRVLVLGMGCLMISRCRRNSEEVDEEAFIVKAATWLCSYAV